MPLQVPHPVAVTGNQGGNRPKTYFPGNKSAQNSNYIPLFLFIYQLMEQIRPHVEVATRSRRSSALWKELHDRFFDRTSGQGRNFDLWTTDGWKKFKKVILHIIGYYSKEFVFNHKAKKFPMVISLDSFKKHLFCYIGKKN